MYNYHSIYDKFINNTRRLSKMYYYGNIEEYSIISASRCIKNKFIKDFKLNQKK